MESTHIPVLEREVIELLDPHPGEVYFEPTAGYGGHAAVIAKRQKLGRMVLSDQDAAAVAALRERFGEKAEIWQLAMSQAARRLERENLTPQMILLDLGVSSPQLDTPERGFSFKHQGPLDMRMDQSSALSAGEVINTYSEARLATIIGRYGEEHRAKTVARAIVAARPITTTNQLAEVIRRVVGRSGRIDPATRTFQAIRMEVNAELSELEAALPILTKQLAPGGRIAVISFHSLEDRIVKQWFERESQGCICQPKLPICTCSHNATLAKLTKKPLSGANDSHNPRARSAKLRAAAKLNQNQKEGT
ncbi:MAG TPA: 16S rRNA (cytosine(1402)-N(4))-methyltransferase RsmH [Candidatus Saccharimonadales bacterium]|nr:16S rRNA (cytosine(1402)-N(4))-methyltransferase RsmH [Candidatus Saccharimonadales bacterium]